MGLAATQVRLLQLTSRQHRIEYQAQRIQAQKLQLSNESDASYNKYMQALDAKKVQYRHIENDGSVSYNDATLKAMYEFGSTEHQYAFEIVNGDDAGKIMVTSTIANKFSAVSAAHKWDNNADVTVDLINKKYQTNFSEDQFNKDVACIRYQKKYIADTFFATDTNFADATDGDRKAYYSNLYILLLDSSISGGGPIAKDALISKHGDSNEWLTNMLENGELIIHKYNIEGGDDAQGAWDQVSLSTDVMLQEVADEKELKRAEATYEAETARINRKDAQYDTILSQTEVERNAIKTEIDELKTVRNENIEKHFKLFS